VSNQRTWSVSAEWILPADGTVHRRAIMRGRGSVIEAVGSESTISPAVHHRELGELAVLPGLVNAHTHLELTHLRGRLPARRPLPQWLYALKTHWPAVADTGGAVADGAAEALETGTTAIADTCHNNSAWRVLKQTPLRSVCYAEVMGIGPLAEGAFERLRKHIRGCRATKKLHFGLCPHAPYTTGEEVYRQTVALAHRRHWPLATHLAETEGERQLLLHGSGKLLDFLLHMGLLNSSVQMPDCTPVDFARRVGILDGPASLLHCNFIDDRELKLLAATNVSVVCCPGSNDFFGRSGHRYAEMLAAGINVAVGTDSLASNESLDMLAELQRIRTEGKVDNQTILKMGTVNGAQAMGLAETIGTLQPGKQADWIAVKVPHDTPAPLEDILIGKGRVMEVHIAGKLACTNRSP